MRRLFLALVLLPALALAQTPQLKQITASALGTSGVVLAGGAVTNPVLLTTGTSPLSYNQVSFAWVVVAGTSTTMTVTCSGSIDYGVTYRPVERCSSGTTYTCTAATWSYDLTTQLTGILNVPTNYTHLKCTFTATGTGTITATAVLNTI